MCNGYTLLYDSELVQHSLILPHTLAKHLQIADAQNKELKYEMVDFHSSRPGHDLRYALSGDKMRELGWVPAKSVRERISQVTQWTLENDRWITL